MDLYARVNILGGRAVRLPRGDVSTAIALDADPLARARGWIEKGIDFLHIVDLDAAAYGDYRNRGLIDMMLRELDVPIQVAGGVRSEVEASRLIAAGAWRIVMGTAAIENQNMVWDLCRVYPDRISVSLDVLPNEELVTRGWTSNSGRFLEEVMVEMSSAGVASLLISEARRDALEEPPDFKLLQDALSYADEPVVAAGGVGDLEDLRALLELRNGDRRLSGLVVGREVTEGRFTVEEAQATITGEHVAAFHRVRQMRTILRVPDWEVAADFYERVLSFRRVREISKPDGAAGVVIDIGDGRMLELVDGGGTPSGVELQFMVRDAEAVRDRIVAAGASIAQDMTSNPWGTRSFCVVDPHGVRVWIAQHDG